VCAVCEQMDNQVIVSDYSQMDRVLRDERQYILNIVKQVKKAGCNVLLVQKSILRYIASPASYLYSPLICGSTRTFVKKRDKIFIFFFWKMDFLLCSELTLRDIAH